MEQQQKKAELRRVLLKARRSLSVEVRQEKSDRICDRIQSSLLVAKARTVLAYFSFRQEPDLTPLFADTKYRWGFSRTVGKSLAWHIWKPGEALQRGDYGILEPRPDAPTIEPAEVDLILVPGVACDRRGYRLGYGGGFYDRMLSSSEWASKSAIGVVFEFAYLPELPVDEWDKPLQAVCTEIGINKVR